MPELPEVEILARHLRPLLHGRTIQSVKVRRRDILEPTSVPRFKKQLRGATFLGLERRGKYLLFELSTGNSHAGHASDSPAPFRLLGHLGMTGRMFLAQKNEPLPKHATVIFDLGSQNFIFDDTRYFGRLTLDLTAVEKLGPEPLEESFTPELFAQELKRSRQPVKVKLLDQSLVAGVGNIYASEALFRAGISPRKPANRLTRAQVEKLRQAIREVLAAAIAWGSTVPLNFNGHDSDGLFYYGSAAGEKDFHTEQLRVYDRNGQPCLTCRTPVKRIVQAARSTFYCPRCQKT